MFLKRPTLTKTYQILPSHFVLTKTKQLPQVLEAKASSHIQMAPTRKNIAAGPLLSA